MRELKEGDTVYIPEEGVKGVIVKIEPNGTTCHVDKTMVGLIDTCRLYETDQLVISKETLERIEREELLEAETLTGHKIVTEWLDSLRDKSTQQS